MAESPFQGGFEEIQPYFVDIIPDRDPVHLPEGVGNVKPVESGEFFQLLQRTVASVFRFNDPLDRLNKTQIVFLSVCRLFFFPEMQSEFIQQQGQRFFHETVDIRLDLIRRKLIQVIPAAVDGHGQVEWKFDHFRGIDDIADAVDLMHICNQAGLKKKEPEAKEIAVGRGIPGTMGDPAVDQYGIAGFYGYQLVIQGKFAFSLKDEKYLPATGGNALKFYASVRLDIRKVTAIKEGDNIVGNQVRVKVVKNKVAPPFRKAEFEITFGEGISKIGELVSLGVEYEIIKKSGSWFSYGDTKLGQGAEAVKEMLKDNPELCEELEGKIMQIINDKA